MNGTITVHSMYNNIVDQRVVVAQQRVFDALGIKLKQHLIEGVSHGEWMDAIIHRNESEITIFCDIDAFPVRGSAFLSALESIKSGNIFGLGQVANHLNPNHIYAGPMFLGFSRATYVRCGSPSMKQTELYDAAQFLTIEAERLGVSISLALPNLTIIPKWPFSNRGVFGIATFYGNQIGEFDFFHLFESRFARNVEIFEKISEDVLCGNLDFSAYLQSANRQESQSKSPIIFRRITNFLRRLASIWSNLRRRQG